MMLESRELFSNITPFGLEKSNPIASQNFTSGELSRQFSKERAAQVGVGLFLVSIGTILILHGADQIGDRHPVTGVILTAAGLYIAKKGLDMFGGQKEAASKSEIDQRLISYQAA